MRRVTLLFALASVSCATGLQVDPEGYRCDPGNLCPAGFLCVEGVCRASGHADGGDVCAMLSCNTPPPPQCLDAATARVFEAQGNCQNGSCIYLYNDLSCPQGCQNGVCAGSLCAGVTCNTPPPTTCTGGQLRTYAATGTCEEPTGTCSYPFTEVPCNGTCVNDVCVGAGLSFVQIGPRVSHEVTAIDQAPSSSGTHVLAVGPAGAVSKWNGTSWTRLSSNTTSDLRAVWFVSSNLAFIAGANRTLLRYDGTALTPVALLGGGNTSHLVALHGRSATHALAASATGEYWRFNGTAWTYGSLAVSNPANAPYDIRAVYIDGVGDERLSGQCATTSGRRACVVYGTGTTWFVDTDVAASLSPEVFRAVGPSVDTAGTSAYVGHSGTASLRRHVSSSGNFDATTVPTVSGSHVAGISRAASSVGQAVYLLTGRGGSGAGRLYRHTNNGLSPANALFEFWLGGSSKGGGQSMSLTDSGGVIVADSSNVAASIFRRGLATPLEVLDLGEMWKAVQVASAFGGAPVLMNSDGDLAFLGTGMGLRAFFRSPTARMNALAPTSSFLLMVGDGGRAYRVSFTGGYTALSTGVTTSLRAACAVSDTELYVAGSAGTLSSYTGGTGLTPMVSGTVADLNDLHCSGQEVVACGANGTILRRTGNSWTAVTPAFPNPGATLTSCRQAGGVLWVAGNNVFAKLESGAWTTLPAQPSLSSLQVRAPNEIYAQASGSSVVRFDGASWVNRFTATRPLRASARTSAGVLFVGDDGVVVEGR
ncbi:MAG: hypothetical protein ACOZIN_06520 [Myxococcota bacterium]